MGRFLLTQMASVAELEAGFISERTKAALAAAKARGVKLPTARGHFGASRRAKEHAANLRSIVDDIRAHGITSVRKIADELNERGILGANGHVSTIYCRNQGIVR
jgi:DNA invertase Pin-like site-specific DNA recombinase